MHTTIKKDPIISTYKKIVRLSKLEEILSRKEEEDKELLIHIIEHRLSNRYFKVINKATKEDLSSFMIMAICCLVIETLECFYEGLANTEEPGLGKKVFKRFFIREKELFLGLEVHSKDFYKSVRCGILHQAETKNAWFLNKTGDLFVYSEGMKFINGVEFFSATKKAIQNYLDILQENNINSEIWKLAYIKLQDVCDNCKI